MVQYQDHHLNTKLLLAWTILYKNKNSIASGNIQHYIILMNVTYTIHEQHQHLSVAEFI